MLFDGMTQHIPVKNHLLIKIKLPHPCEPDPPPHEKTPAGFSVPYRLCPGSPYPGHLPGPAVEQLRKINE